MWLQHAVFVSCGCCNKLPNLMAQTTQIDYFIVLEVKSMTWVSLNQKSRYWQAVFPPEALWENLFLTSPASRIHLHSLASGPFVHLQSQQCSISPFSLTLTFCLLLPRVKDSCDHFGPTQIIQDYLLTVSQLISNLNLICFPSPPIFVRCNRTYSQAPWTSLRTIILPMTHAIQDVQGDGEEKSLPDPSI